MHTLRFWNTWPKNHQLFFWIFISFALTTLTVFWMAYFIYPSPTLQWEHFQLMQTELVPLQSFTLGLFEFTVNADNTLVYESMLGSAPQPSALAFYFFLIVIVISSLAILTIITTLKRFWFLMGMGLFILFLASLRLESMQIWGITNKIPAGVIIFLYIALSFYFQSFNTQAQFGKRFLSLMVLTTVIALVIYFTSPVPYHFLLLSASGITVGLIIGILFIFMVAHEIIASMIWISGQKNSKSLRQFAILAGIYLANLLLTYFQKTGYLDWGVYTLNLFLVLSISGILSLWGFRQREEQYGNITSADPFGVYLIISLATIAFASISFFFLTANDPVINLIQSLILYSQLGYGIIFILYIISNYGPMLTKNLPVYKVLYKPQTMPYFTFRTAGLIATYAFLSYDINWQSALDKAFAGYYNGYGDVYYIQSDAQSAIGYFKRAAVYRQTNHHAHYALATIYAAQVDPLNERAEYARAIELTPTPYSYINFTDNYDRVNEFERSAYWLRHGLKALPNDGALANALGLAYSRLNRSDSALYFFQTAKENGLEQIAATNLIAETIKIKSTFPADSLYNLLGSDAEGPKSNALAMANLQQKQIEISIDEALIDTTLTAYRASLISNYLINQREKADTALINSVVELGNRPVNENFRESVLLAAAHAYYAHGLVNKAFRLVRQLAFLSSSGKYHTLLGLWSLEQRNPLMAADYFEKARDRQAPNAAFNSAVAWAECDSIAKAIDVWKSIQQRGDSLNASIATGMINVLSATSKTALQFSEEDRYRFLHYTLSMFDESSFETIINSIDNDDMKAMALLDMGKRWYEFDEPEIAAGLLAQTVGLKIRNAAVAEEIKYFGLMLVAAGKDWKALKENLGKYPYYGVHAIEKIYFEALLAEETGNLAEAETKYRSLMAANVQFEDGLVAAIEFLAKHKKNDTQVYQVLIDGLLIKPNSVKLMKAYTRESVRLGFEEEALQMLEKLRSRLSFNAFKKFVEGNPRLFSTP